VVVIVDPSHPGSFIGGKPARRSSTGIDKGRDYTGLGKGKEKTVKPVFGYRSAP